MMEKSVYIQGVFNRIHSHRTYLQDLKGWKKAVTVNISNEMGSFLCSVH